MDQVKVPARFEKALCCPCHVVKIAKNLVSGDCLGAFWILQAVPSDHVGRVARHYAKRSRRKQCVCLFDISLQDPDSVFDPVELYAPHCHFRAVGLDFKPDQVPAVRLCRHQERDDPCPGAQIQEVLVRHGAPADSVLNESGEQHCVHAKTEPGRVLNDPKAAALQIVDLLSRTQEFLCRVSGFLCRACRFLSQAGGFLHREMILDDFVHSYAPVSGAPVPGPLCPCPPGWLFGFLRLLNLRFPRSWRLPRSWRSPRFW